MKIWILNHYATNTYIDRAGRHYSFAKHLRAKGYDATVFCASTVHNSDEIMPTEKGLYGENTVDGIPYVFIKTSPYAGNGLSRVKNMLVFSLNLIRTLNKKAKAEKPDVVIASSVHPFTCVSGILAAKKMKVPCIVEIRDLWPASIVAYTDRAENNIAVKFLYMLEKWIYKKAHKIIFTMEGGKDYIIDKKWDKANGGPIDLDKVYHINNGVDLQVFDKAVEEFVFEDADLDEDGTFKVVYTGSIRRVNNVGTLVSMAEKATEQGVEDIKFLVYGDGDERELLQKQVEEKKLTNIVFKGRAEKLAIPYILSKADATYMHADQTPIMRFGCSLNKLFEYLAVGKPIVSDLITNYDIIKRYSCGIVTDSQNPEEVLNAILMIKSLNEKDYKQICNNCRNCAENYDFEELTANLIKIIND